MIRIIVMLYVYVVLLIFFTAFTDCATSLNVSFAESIYSVNEKDGVLHPVLVLSESSSTNITVELDITATGKTSVVTQAIW